MSYFTVPRLGSDRSLRFQFEHVAKNGTVTKYSRLVSVFGQLSQILLSLPHPMRSEREFSKLKISLCVVAELNKETVFVKDFLLKKQR